MNRRGCAAHEVPRQKMYSNAVSNAPRVALVGCSAKKRPNPADARSFYTSNLFRASLAYAEASCARTFVVSAMYELLSLDDVVEPYDMKLDKLGKVYRDAWGVRTLRHFASWKMKPVLVILAGNVYVEALLHGAHWHHLPRPEEPLKGIRGVGKRITWLEEHTHKRKG